MYGGFATITSNNGEEEEEEEEEEDAVEEAVEEADVAVDSDLAEEVDFDLTVEDFDLTVDVAVDEGGGDKAEGEAEGEGVCGLKS